MQLPKTFLKRMQIYLLDEYDEFLASFSEPAKKGIRINPLKACEETIAAAFNSSIKKSPFSELSFYIDHRKVGDMPFHAAGAFYSQEPSASSAVTILNPKAGDKVLDLCAAPGGKSTQIASLLHGEGLLWSNEIVKSRANILLSNIERMGVKNAVVSSCHPDILCDSLAGFFDKVLVDAPCSGEGMFRKNPDAIQEWSPEHVLACASRQTAILNSAATCVKENGVLVYSTCTFSKDENEDVCLKFIADNPDFAIASPNVTFGRKAMGIDAIRILPMDGGEGHFVAKFIRNSSNYKSPKLFSYPEKSTDMMQAKELYKKLFFDEPFGEIMRVKDKLLILPNNLPQIKKLGVFRAGVELGEFKGNRIEPSHSLFASQQADNCRSVLNFSNNDKNLLKFIHGEEIECSLNGFTAVSVEGAVIGFGKASNGMLKNKYPKGLRSKK